MSEGHSVGGTGGIRRSWQDGVRKMDESRAARELDAAAGVFEEILGRRPQASGAPGWVVSAASLRAQDKLGLAYASDLRGGPACRLRAGGEIFATPQLPTTTPCIEELPPP